MTARTDYRIPYDRDKVRSGDPMKLDEALYEIVKSVEDNQQRNSREINGDIRADYSEDGVKWTPILKDTADSTTTFDYTGVGHQIGFVMRKGLVADVWFDIQWIGIKTGAITGNMYLELPYLVTKSSQMPFVGGVQASAIAYTAGTGVVMNAIQDTRRGEIWNVGSGITTARQGSKSTGRIMGYIRYIGQQNES